MVNKRTAIPLIMLLVFGLPAIVAAQQPPPENLTYGFFMLRYSEQLEDVPALNVRWVRMGGLAAWNLVEPNPGSGIYNFSQPDQIIAEAANLNLSLLLTFAHRNDNDPGASIKALPTDMNAYKAFVRAFVERYDGDGVDDAPASPVVRYWQVGNEPDNVDENGVRVEWNDTPENYALFLNETTTVIREANPGAVVLIAGLAQGRRGLNDFYEPMFVALDGYGAGPRFDIFDVHWFGQTATNDYMGLDNVMLDIRTMLEALGYGGTAIWVTETATYSDTPVGLPTQTEQEHARDLAKRLIHYRGLGAEKVFWTPLTEFHNWNGEPNSYFDNTGLINNPLNDGNSSKKKAYYTCQFLASKIDGAVVAVDSPFMQLVASSVFQGCEFSADGAP